MKNISPNKHRLLLVSMLLLWCFAFSQTPDSVVSNYINQLTNIWNKNSGTTFKEYTGISNSDFSVLKPFFTTQNATVSQSLKQLNELKLKVNLTEQEIYKKDPGLNFVANYQRNFQSPIADPEDVVVFRQRFQAGVEWDILKSGLYDNGVKLKQLKYKQKAIEFQTAQSVNNIILKNNFNYIVYLLNNQKVDILNTRKKFIESFAGIATHLLSLNYISKESYIKVNQHLNDINYQLNIYQYYNQTHNYLKLKTLDNVELPPFDIDYEKVIAKIFINQNTVDSVAYYNMMAATSPNYVLKDMTLRPNVKYNFYDIYNSSLPNRSYVSLGVNFSMPLAFNASNKKQKDILMAQIASIDTKEGIGMDTQNVVLNSLYEFKYKQKQYSNLLQKRELFEELLRNEKVKNQFKNVEFNPLTANIILDDYWSTVIELLDLRQDMYRILSELKQKFPSLEVSEIVKPYYYEYTMVQESEKLKNNFVNVSAVYIWSDAFKNNTPGYIANYCKLNNFNTLVVSGNKSFSKEINELIKTNPGFNYELMISSNKLLKTGTMAAELDSLTKLFNIKELTAIHLDIEPQALEYFKENKEKYFEKYLELVNTAYQFTQNSKIKLNVSIPLYYPENVLTSIFGKCDRVYLMAYENVKPEFIKEKIKEEQSAGKSKIVLALRTNDFKNKAAMDEMFEGLEFKNVAYHDLDELIKWSKKNIIKGSGK